MEDDDDKNLPAIYEGEYKPAVKLDETAQLQQIRKSDVELWNGQMGFLESMLPKLSTTRASFEWHDRVMDMIERRRAIHGFEYGSPAGKVTRQTVFEPVE